MIEGTRSRCELGLDGILSRLEYNSFLMIIGFVWGHVTVFTLKYKKKKKKKKKIKNKKKKKNFFKLNKKKLFLIKFLAFKKKINLKYILKRD